LEVEEGFEETGTIEVGPEGFGDEDFGVGDLPEKEITDAHFAAGADEQIGIREIRGVEVARDFVFCDQRWGDRRRVMASGEDGVYGVDQFGAAAVVEGDGEDHARVGRSGFGGFARIFLDGGGKIFGAAEEAHTDVVALDEGHFLAQIFAEKLHEEFDFSFGAAPVFHREGVERKGFDMETGTGFDGGPGGLRACAVAGDAGEVAFLGPAAVAVHDDGDMAREPREIETFEEAGLFCGDGSKRGGKGEGLVVSGGHGDFR